MATASIQTCANCNKTQSSLTTPLLRCGRCQSVAYCSKTCQSTAWPAHKPQCKATATPTFSGPPTVPANGHPKRVILLELDDYSWLGDMYANFQTEMTAACDFQKVTKTSAVVGELRSNPNAVILFEPSVMNVKKQLKHEAINKTLVAYAKAGGTVVFGCQCSSNVTPPSLNWYFENIWGLPWKTGNYARFDFQPNASAEGIHGRPVPAEYCVKALQLAGVEESAVLYLQAGESHSLAGLPTPADMGSTSGPVSWQKYGEGWVGWIGDVNNEATTREIVKMMCGI